MPNLTVAELEQFCKKHGLKVRIYDYAEANGERSTARKTDEHFVLGAEISADGKIFYLLDFDEVENWWTLDAWKSGESELKLCVKRIFVNIENALNHLKAYLT